MTLVLAVLPSLIETRHSFGHHPVQLCRPRCRAVGLYGRASRYSDRFESDTVYYDEYYNGETALHESDVTVRDVSWAELSRIKEFQQETPPTFNAHLKVSASCLQQRFRRPAPSIACRVPLLPTNIWGVCCCRNLLA